MEETQIKELIIECYLNGALNEMNTDAMQKGYHQDFAIFFAEETELKRLELSHWVQMVEEFKQSNQSDSGLRDFSHEFVSVDVTSDAAAVKLKLFRQERLIFTDYITLLKFKDDWKIVTKIYHSHVDNPWKL